VERKKRYERHEKTENKRKETRNSSKHFSLLFFSVDGFMSVRVEVNNSLRFKRHISRSTITSFPLAVVESQADQPYHRKKNSGFEIVSQM